VRILKKKKFLVTLEVEMTDPANYWYHWSARDYVKRIVEKTRPHMWSAQDIHIEVIGSADVPEPEKGPSPGTLRLLVVLTVLALAVASVLIPGLAKYLTLGR
jgi:hypothetical protein